MLSAFSTSTMKSEPGRLTISSLAVAGGVVTRPGSLGVMLAAAPVVGSRLVPTAAALAAAAPFRNNRRCTPPLASPEAMTPSSFVIAAAGARAGYSGGDVTARHLSSQ